jgi:large subunit ribosomal protein L21
MYAVIKAGGKQLRVKPGDVIEVELMDVDGGTVTFQPILVVDDEGATHVGKSVTKAIVTASTLGDKKGEKVRVMKYRPKTGYSRQAGHRQTHTLLQIEDVKLSGSAARASSKSTPTPAAKPKTASAPKSQSPAKRTSRSKSEAPKPAKEGAAAEE